MKYLFVVCLVILMTYSSLSAGTTAATVKYDYSKSLDFPQGLELGKFMAQISAKPGITQTLMGVNMILNAVTVKFDASLTGSEILALDAVVSAHTPDTPLEQFCVTLPDADSTITSAMVQVGLLIVNSAVTRTHTMVTASQMVSDGEYRGSFYFVNAGSATAIVAVANGMASQGSLSVDAGGNGRFMYSLTDYTQGSEMYMLIRVS